MRFLCCFTILLGAQFLRAQQLTNHTTLHNEVYNYAFSYPEAAQLRAFDAWERYAFLQDEEGKVLDVNRQHLKLYEDSEPTSEQLALGGYEIKSETAYWAVRTFPNMGARAELIPFFSSMIWSKELPVMKAHEMDEMTIWIPTKLLTFLEFPDSNQVYQVVMANFAVQLGQQLLCFWAAAPSETEWDIDEANSAIEALLNQIEINGTRLQFALSEQQEWQLVGEKGKYTQVLSTAAIDQQVNSALFEAEKQPDLQFGTRADFADQGTYTDYSLDVDQLYFQAPDEVMRHYPESAPAVISDPYILTDNFRLKRIGSRVRYIGQAPTYNVIDTLKGHSLYVQSIDRTKTEELSVLSVKGKRWTKEEITTFYQASVDDEYFSGALAEELLPDGRTRLYYGTEMNANFDFRNEDPVFLDQAPSAVLFLQYDDWLHTIEITRTFSFQLLDMLERIEYQGLQFAFEHKNRTLRLRNVFEKKD